MTFYLNYVGCKVFLLLHLEKEDHRFTLTMWDVKFWCINKRWYGIYSFTLTMWDVKTLTKQNQGVKGAEFYLNYVGCKVLLFFFFRRIRIVLP